MILLGAGCQPDSDDTASTVGEGEVSLELFNKNKGVHLPSKMQLDLHLATVEVAERTQVRRLDKPAQVYRAAQGATMAAAVVWLNETESRQFHVGESVTLMATRPSSETSRGRFSDKDDKPLQDHASALTGKFVRLIQQTPGAYGQSEALIEFADVDGRFLVGSSLLVRFSHSDGRSALSIPESAVIDGVAGAFVYAANGEHFTRTQVKVGSVTDGWVEVIDGLYAGDVVATKAVDSLWLIELCALKGGTPCCPAPLKKSDK